MYFEARSHEVVEVANAEAAVRLIASGQCKSFQTPVWRNASGHRIALVDDSHINCGDFGECAVVNLDTRRQLESLTFAWMESEEEKLRYVLDCENDPGFDTECVVP